MDHKISVEQAWFEYQQKLLSYISAKVDTRADAEDILSEVFSKLAKRVSVNKSPENIGPWLYHVSKNQIVDYYRSKSNFEDLPDDLTQEGHQADAIKSLSKCMLPMIRALPESYQQPLMLSEIEGCKYKDVATELGLTLAAVKSRILRGRKMLHGNILTCCELKRSHQGKISDYGVKTSSSCSNC
jgi:RNA polymerase sigma-70 factor (ECF subfamily)